MKILVTAEHFGYGPIATCLNVIKELKKEENMFLTFMGTGIALEQAKMSNYFDKIIECKTYDEDEIKKFRNEILVHQIFLSSENINGAKYALKIGHKNVYYIDNLMWMWDKLEEGLENLKGYFISETLPCKENFLRIGKNIKNPIFVGPIREIKEKENNKKENKLIINIGGAEAFIIDSNLVIDFYNKLINEILSTNNLKEKFKKIIVCGGSGVINNIKIKDKTENITLKTLSNSDYLEELKTASHCIMASGLGNFVETIWRDKDILYLPPINYSQLLQLNYYKKMNLGFEIINWDNFDFYEEIPKLLNEEVGVNLVLENVKKYLKNNSKVINEFIKNFIDTPQDSYYSDRKEYSKQLKKDASKEIVKYILNK